MLRSRFLTLLFLGCTIHAATLAARSQSTFQTPAISTNEDVKTGRPAAFPSRTNSTRDGRNLEPDFRIQPPLVTAEPVERTIKVPESKSDFQRFAEDEAGRDLPVFGRSLFNQVPSTFAPADQVPVPSDYAIGPGDEILISIWGKIDLDGSFIVDRNGQISLPKVGTLRIAGTHADQLESRIRDAVGVIYRDFQVNVTLGHLRSIQIYVTGSARQPGAYTVSALSTLVNALFASGGPSSTGSMRLIQLRRADRTIAEFDLYDLLRNGDKSHDHPLLNGDVIYIPAVGPQIAVLGSVNEPGIYELKQGSSVDSALRDAGGLTALAAVDKAIIERIEDHRARHVDEFPLDSVGLQHPVANGDLLRVFPLSPRFENSVTLRGNVFRPGRFPWHEGMRIADLIPNREILISRDYWNQRNHSLPIDSDNPFAADSARYRDQADAGARMESEFRSRDITGPGWDNTMDQGTDSSERQQIELRSERPQNNAATQTRNRTLNSEDTPTIATIGKITAEINWEYAVIERLDSRDLTAHLIPFRLATAIDDHASVDNQVLMSGDVITIFSRSDLELPMEKHAIFVRVGGEVAAPGVYRVQPGETLQDVVRKCGGLTAHAYLYASKFTRVSTRRAEEQQLRQASQQMQKDLIGRYASAAPTPGQTLMDQQAQLSLQQSTLAKLSTIKPDGRIVLQMKPTATTIDEIPPLQLEDGDALYVPPRLSTIQVEGSVYNPNAFRYQQDKLLKSYLNDAGGPTRDADKSRVFVIRADGTVISRQSSKAHFPSKFESLKMLPGDAIVVPERLKTPGGIKGILQATQGISQAAITAAALSAVVP